MSDELDVDWSTVTWRQLIEAIRKQKAESSFAAPPCCATRPITDFSEKCGNCGSARTVIDGVIQKCAVCGDEEIDTNDIYGNEGP